MTVLLYMDHRVPKAITVGLRRVIALESSDIKAEPVIH